MDLFKGSKASRTGNSNNNNDPELTLSYLCDKDPKGVAGMDTIHHKVRKDDGGGGGDSGIGVGVGVGDDCVEMDFMNLNESSCSDSRRWDRSSKRGLAVVAEAEGVDADVRQGGAGREKRSKIEALNLSLALPEVSPLLPAVYPLGNGCGDAGTGLQSLAPLSSARTTTTYSNDFTAASMSYSGTRSCLFSHNPSCSLTCNSTENYDYSVGNKGRDSQIWYAGEGTNGSVHSRFKPLEDGGRVALANTGGIGGNESSLNLVTQGSGQISRDCSSSFYQSTNSERYSYLPSELPACPTRDAISGDSRGKNCENSWDLDSLAGGTARRITRFDRLVREIVSESIPVMSQIVQELSEEVLESTKEYLRRLFDALEQTDELTGLQRKLDKRSDLTKETLSKCNKDLLLILVALRTGIGIFLSGKSKIPSSELIEIFLFVRCRNVNCKMLLPVDDCECKVCSTNRGFCSSCMCPVCLKFDCASNTCSWVGCDLCSHWCHVSCGIQKNLIRPVPSTNSGSAEMRFYCMGCNHASEMYGFVKDVFSCFAKDWGAKSLMKELDCVGKIFKRSEDFKGKELHMMADELLSQLEAKIISPSDACDAIMKLFHGVDRMSGFSDRHISSDPDHRLQPFYTRPPPIPPRESQDDIRKEIKASQSKERCPEDNLMAMMRKDGFDSMESVIRIKEAEARMYQSKADEATREAGVFERMIRAKMDELEEEYDRKISGVCLKDAEDKRRKKLEELKALEDSHCDYQEMKMRMQSKIAGLLERMEATKMRRIS